MIPDAAVRAATLGEVEHIEVTERFIAASFPHASIAVVGGSTAHGTRTETSDIDLLLIDDALFSDGRTSLAATYAFETEVFEVFAYTRAGFDDWAYRGLAQHRPVIVQILVDGIGVRGGADLDELRRPWAETLAAGPEPDPHGSALRRYMITDMLDDLRDARDPLESRVIAFALFEKTAELMLLDDRRWIATGKHLPRRLREMSGERTDLLARPLLAGDHAAFADRVEHELDRAGGRVRAGFTR